MSRIPAIMAICLLIAASVYGQQVPVGAMPEQNDADAGVDFRVRPARVRYGGGGDWYADPSSLPNLLREFEERTGIPTARDEKVIDLADPELPLYPFLYMTGHGNIRLTGL